MRNKSKQTQCQEIMWFDLKRYLLHNHLYSLFQGHSTKMEMTALVAFLIWFSDNLGLRIHEPLYRDKHYSIVEYTSLSLGS